MNYPTQKSQPMKTHWVSYLADGLGVRREQGDGMTFHSEIPESQNSIIRARTQHVRLHRVTRNAGQANLKNKKKKLKSQ